MPAERLTGKVARYDSVKGVGVISQPSGKEVLVSRSALDRANIQGLAEGDRVEFDIIASDRGPQAVNLKLL
jgi:CspA family cold shock protein